GRELGAARGRRGLRARAARRAGGAGRGAVQAAARPGAPRAGRRRGAGGGRAAGRLGRPRARRRGGRAARGRRAGVRTGSRPLRVLALTRTSRRGPSTRYRIEQYRAELAARGIELETRPLFGDAWFSILERRPPLRGLLKAGYSLARLAARTAQAGAAARGGH